MQGTVHQNHTPLIAGERREIAVVQLLLDSPHAADDLHASFVDAAMRGVVGIVAAYEGTIDRFIGTGCVALFGAPISHENAAVRALQAALDIRALLRSLCDEHGRDETAPFRLAVHSGPIVVGNEAPDLDVAFTALDNTLLLPAHMIRLAPPGVVVASQAIVQQTRASFPFTQLSLSGGQVEPIYELLHASAVIKPTAPAHQSPFVGRSEQLSQLQAAFAVVASRQHSGVVLLRGEAGVGKTRLLDEWRRSLPSTVAIRGAICHSYTRSRSLWLVSELVRGFLNVPAQKSADAQQRAVVASLRRLGLANANVAPYVLHLLDLPQLDAHAERQLRFLDPSVLQRQTHAAVRQVMLAATGTTASVVILEDLHWIDAASRDFLAYLLPSINEVPLLLALVVRDVEREAGLAPLIDALQPVADAVFDLPLQTLPQPDATALVGQLLPLSQESSGLHEQIAARAQGNPLFIEEIVRTLLDQQAIVRVDGNWRLTDQAQQVVNAVPGTIQALMLSRFHRLPQTLRRTLQRAAICGMRFAPALLQPLIPAGARALTDDLDELVARLVLSRDEQRTEPSYSFRHNLLHEAVYHTLLLPDRQQLHAQVADALLSLDPLTDEERADALAHHFSLGPIPVRAVPYLVQSGEHSAQRFDNDGAIRRFRQALALMTEDHRARDQFFVPACIGLGQALKFVGSFDEAARVLQQAIDFHRHSFADKPEGRAVQLRALLELAEVRHRSGALEQAIELLDEGLALLADSEHTQLITLWRALLERKAFVRFRQGRLDEAIALAHGALPDHVAGADDPLTLASLFNTLGGVSWQQGKLPAAAAYVERSLALYESLGYSFGVANAAMNLGILLYSQGQWSQAAQSFERSDVLRAAAGAVLGRAGNLLNLGILLTAMGAHAAAREQLIASLSLSRRLGDDHFSLRAEIALCHLAVLRGHRRQAATHLMQASQLLAAAGEDERIQLDYLQALLHLQAGRLDQAVALAQSALDLSRAAGIPEQETECLRVLGMVHVARGEFDAARGALQAALSLARKRHDSYQEALALLEQGQLALRQIQRETEHDEAVYRLAEECLEAAAALFARLGAAFDLRRCRRARRRLAKAPAAVAV